MHIALFAGEASGDQLGAELIKSLKKINPDIRCDGVGGELMKAEGFQSLLPMEKFSVMGITEILKALPRLLYYRKKLFKHYSNNKPNVFIGIDYPEFNLSLENRLKAQGIYTVHYVSPSVWAWREERIHHIKESCDLMLTLFDFEKKFYDAHQMPAVYCGHPLIDILNNNESGVGNTGIDASDNSETNKTTIARETLGLLSKKGNYLAVLPGSRKSEVDKMMAVYVEVMLKLQEYLPDLQFIIPAATQALQTHLQKQLSQYDDRLNYHIFLRQGHTVMQAADAVLLTSGTATLEAMLLEKPMLVSYKVSNLTARLAKKKLNVQYFSLPNLLAQKEVVPEFMQDDIDTDKMAECLLKMIMPTAYRSDMVASLQSIRNTIKTNAADNAAQAIYADMQSRGLV